MYGPVAMAFDPWGDLWTVNLNTGTVVELTRAQLGMPNPVPSVTVTLPSGAVAVPTGMAFDPSGNLWVVDSGVSQIVEYTRGQLATSGSPTPQAIISKTIPGDPLGDMFDRSGNLWVTVQISSSCPQGCVVEFSRAELAMTNPTPTVTITSTGGANMAFTESGDMWMVTGGGAAVGTPGCFGTPCTNELVEFTRPSSADRVPPHLLSRSAPRLLMPRGLCSALTASPSPPLVTFGFPISTNPQQSSTASTSFPGRGRPSHCGPSVVGLPR